MSRRSPLRQETMFPEEKDPAIVKIADRVVELQKEFTASKERKEVQEKSLVGLMKKAGRQKIRHGGMLFEVKETPGKETLKVKAEKKKQ